MSAPQRTRIMKITSIETIPVRVPLKPQFTITSGRGGSHVTSPFLLVKVHTDEGLVGLGEASCTPRWSGEDQFSAQHFIKAYFEPALVDHDPTDVAGCSKLFMPVVAGNPFTKAAVEMALWDLAGKAAGKPVYELLGGKVRDVVPTKWSVSGRDPEPAAEIARWAVGAGFRKMKVKVGIDLDGDVARVRAVRAVVGPDVTLGVDANGGWVTPGNAVGAIGRLLEFDIAFVEQPVRAGDVFGMWEARQVFADLPFIADESVYTLQDAENLANADACDVLSIYVGKAGGIGPARAIADFAQSAGLACTIGSNLEMGIGSAAMIHLAVATRGVTAEQYACDIIGPLFYEDDVLLKPLPLKPGEARPPEGPGLGVELDDAKIERYRVG
jgi:L-alanine-DL-glutamate epimerase-like enolase superfamily enzyme